VLLSEQMPPPEVPPSQSVEYWECRGLGTLPCSRFPRPDRAKAFDWEGLPCWDLGEWRGLLPALLVPLPGCSRALEGALPAAAPLLLLLLPPRLLVGVLLGFCEVDRTSW
jgi:hypothetical protein